MRKNNLLILFVLVLFIVVAFFLDSFALGQGKILKNKKLISDTSQIIVADQKKSLNDILGNTLKNKIFRIYIVENEEELISGFPIDDELDSVTVAVERSNIIVLVPQGYEELGKAHVKDLENCKPLLRNFLGIAFPREKIILKIYISSDGANGGFQWKGIIFYERSQENIDWDLEAVVENNEEGSLYKSGPRYCANTHELTHAFLNAAPITGWGDEGFAEYSQKVNQSGSRDDIECQENGVLRTDWWGGDVERRVFLFADLSEEIGEEPEDGPIWYNTSMCMVEEIKNTYGNRNFKNIFRNLAQYQRDPDLLSENLGDWSGSIATDDYLFVTQVLVEELGEGVYDLLEKYGIDRRDYE